MSVKTAIKHFGIVSILVLSLSFGLVQPVFAADKVSLSPATSTITEGQSQDVTIALDEPIISGDSDPGYLYFNLEVEDSDRVSLSDSSVYYDSAEWSQTKTFNITADDDPLLNGSETATIYFDVVSNSEFYDGFSGSIEVTVNDNDVAPTVGITYPKPGQSVPAGSLMVTGTATTDKEIVVKVDGKTAGTTESNQAGDWQLLVPKVSAGSHDIVAQVQTSDHYAYMANAYTNSIDVVNLDKHSYVYEIKNADSAGATYNTHNNKVYSASYTNGQCYIAIYNPLTFVREATIGDESNPEGCSAQSMTLSHDGKTGYMLYYDTDTSHYSIMVANLATNSLTSSTQLDELDNNYPSGITLSPDSTELWIRTGTGIERISTTGYINLGHIELSETATAYRQNIVFNEAGTKAYTADGVAGVVHVIDANTLQVLESITVDDNVNMVALTPDGSKLYVAASYPTSAIFVIDTANNQIIQTEEVDQGLPPESLAINSDGQWVVGDDHGSGAIFFGDVSSGATVADTIYAPQGGSYYTSTSNFASPTLVDVLGVSTSIEFAATAYKTPNTGL